MRNGNTGLGMDTFAERDKVIVEERVDPPKTKIDPAPSGPNRRGPRAPAITPFKKKT